MDNDDPYFRNDPDTGIQRIVVFKFDLENKFNEWKSWRTNDGRILPNASSSFELITSPFEPGSLIQLNVSFDPAFAGRTFGGFGIRAPINPALEIKDNTLIEFDLYYPKSAAGKYMRFEIWSTSTGGEGEQANAGLAGINRTQAYIRTENLYNIGNLTPDWMDFYKGDTWYKKIIRVSSPLSAGTWEYLNIDIHTETATKVEKGILLIGNIRITQDDPKGMVVPEVINTKYFSEVTPIKNKYNPDNGFFLIGTAGAGTVKPNTIRQHHFEIFTDESDLKPECHTKPPKWLIDMYPDFNFKNKEVDGHEWNIPTDNYLRLRDSIDLSDKIHRSNYKAHGTCLACIDHTPAWMMQIIPENITSMEWSKDGLYFSGGKNVEGPFIKLPKEIVRRIYFDHIMYIMRHLMSVDVRYGSDKERGIIPFHSYDVLSVEMHESRFSSLIPENPNIWKPALQHTSWLMAMTDDDYQKDIRLHYIYLLYKYAHIAVPNAQMAEKFKAGYNDSNIVPEYMKPDNHDKDGSIDEYINEKPPILIYNEYITINYSKVRVVYNMIKELNTAWKSDPLYDERNLIECMGIQGHDTVKPKTASQNQRFMSLFASLIDEGLLDSICYSEVDLKQEDDAPGGCASAPDVLNQKQADAIGYQYALLFKLFERYKKYIDHVIFWSQYGASWENSYVLFDHEQKASQAYYAIMDPDRFIKGHSYLSEYFEGEYEKIKV